MLQPAPATHTLGRPLRDAAAYSSAVTVAEAQAHRYHLAEFFRQPTGYAWRVRFSEPPLEQVRGIGPKLLPFDF